MKINHSTTNRPLSRPKRLALNLGALGGMLAAGLLLPAGSARADGGSPGNNAPHQERNPSSHPELFTLVAPSQAVASSRGITTAGTRSGHRAAVTVNRVAIFATTAPAVEKEDGRDEDDRPGTGAPHQERNPSQHPELWGGGADKR